MTSTPARAYRLEAASSPHYGVNNLLFFFLQIKTCKETVCILDAILNEKSTAIISWITILSGVPRGCIVQRMSTLPLTLPCKLEYQRGRFVVQNRLDYAVQCSFECHVLQHFEGHDRVAKAHTLAQEGRHRRASEPREQHPGAQSLCCRRPHVRLRWPPICIPEVRRHEALWYCSIQSWANLSYQYKFRHLITDFFCGPRQEVDPSKRCRRSHDIFKAITRVAGDWQRCIKSFSDSQSSEEPQLQVHVSFLRCRKAFHIPGNPNLRVEAQDACAQVPQRALQCYDSSQLLHAAPFERIWCKIRKFHGADYVGLWQR